MYLKKSKYGMTLTEVLVSMGVSAFIMCAVLGLLSNTLLHKQHSNDIFNEWQAKSRILTTIESRIANAGLGTPPSEKIENIFRFTPSGVSMLPGWTDSLEILTIHDIPAPFQDVDGDQVARGERMRVLSTHNAASSVRIIPASAEWGPREIRTVNIRKPQNEFFSYPFEPDELSSWITMPSLGRPVIIKSITADYAPNSGSIGLQNPLFVSMDWNGIDMFHSFRISYFLVEAETFYIMDSAKKDAPSALQKEPIVDDVLSSCFELNKTTKTLKCWFLIRSSSPSVKTGIPHGWPAWAITQPNISYSKMKVISHSWRLKNT